MKNSRFASLLPAQPSLSVSLLCPSLVHLQPSTHPNSTPSSDPEIHGIVTLALPKPRKIKQITVGLVGRASLAFSDLPYETAECLNSRVVLLPGAETFSAGEHKFTFRIIVPSSSAPYANSQHGRIVHRVVAEVKASGLTLAGKLTAETYVELVAAPSSASPDADTILDAHSDSFTEEVGLLPPLQPPLNLRPPHIHIHPPLPPYELVIHDITAKVIETCTLTSLQLKNERRTCGTYASRTMPAKTITIGTVEQEGGERVAPLSPPPRACGNTNNQSRPSTASSTVSASSSSSSSTSPSSPTPPAFGQWKRKAPLTPEASQGPLASLNECEAYTITRLARLPTCEHLQASTHPGTITPVHVKHVLHVDIAYTLSGHATLNRKRRLRISKPVLIHSCSCLLSNLILPPYEASPPPAFSEPDTSNAHSLCACRFTTKALMEAEKWSMDLRSVAPPRTSAVDPGALTFPLEKSRGMEVSAPIMMLA